MVARATNSVSTLAVIHTSSISCSRISVRC